MSIKTGHETVNTKNIPKIDSKKFYISILTIPILI